MDKTLDRAWLLMRSNRFDRSEQEIRKHLSENPDDASAHTMLAMCVFDLSRHDEAIESAKKAIELVPENPYPYWVLGCLYIRLQQLDPAEEYLFEAIELDPEYPDFHASLSELYWLRGSSRDLTYEKRKEFLEKGVEAARISLEINPEHVNSILYLIRNLLMFEDKHHSSEVIELAEQLISIAPENAVVHEAYAQVLICDIWGRRKTQQDLNRILPILEESLRLNPNRHYSKDLAFNLLRSYYRIFHYQQSWWRTFFTIVIIATLPLLILTFYFYHVWGLQIYPTGISFGSTMVGLVIMLEGAYTEARIWSNRHYRKYLSSRSDSTLVLKLFWGGFFIISLIGSSWNIVPIGITRIATFLMWIALFLFGIFVFFIVRRSPWGLSRFGTADSDISSRKNSPNVEYENIDMNEQLRKALPYIFAGILGVTYSIFFPKNPPHKKPLNQQSNNNYLVYPTATHNQPDDIT